MKQVTSIFFVFLSLFSSSAFAVAGGQALTPNDPEYYSVVNIKMKNGMCSGIVAGRTAVLTASHCRDLFGEAEMVALLNKGPTEKCDISLAIDGQHLPGALPELPRRVHAPDLYLIRLKTPLCHAQPATLSRRPIAVGEEFWGAGHGAGNHVFGQAEKFALKVIDPDQARSRITPFDAIAEEFLSVGLRTLKYALPVQAGSSFCHGDSGGAVFRPTANTVEVVAVNSAIQPNQSLGTPACEQAYVQIIAPVAPYVDWIETKIRQWDAEPQLMETSMR